MSESDTIALLQAQNAELKRRLEALEADGGRHHGESRERLQFALDAAGVGTWRVELASGLATCDANLNRLLGLEAVETTVPLAEYFERIHADDRDAVRAAWERALAGEPYDVTHRLIRSDGRVRWVRDRGRVVLDPEGVPRSVVGAMVDITDRKLAEELVRWSEQRFRSMANTTPAMIWTADPSGAITFHNQRWLDYTGIDLADNVRDWPRLVLHRDDYERCLEQWTEALRSGGEYEIEVRNRHRSGEYRWFLTRATPIRDSAGRIVEWSGSTTDIHDRKLAEQSLEEQDRRKDEFLAMLAHELRNPLAPIRNAVELLRLCATPDTDLDEARDIIDRQVTHLSRLVDDLLDVSRVSRGKIQLRRARLDLADAVRQAVETTRPLIDARRHELTVTLPAEPIHLEGDLTRLTQVVGNLLNNAAKYTDEGGRIDLVVTQEDGAQGRRAVLRVRDSGRGIDPAALTNLFGLFYQVDRNLDRSEGGLGIGLALVKTLVEMHGGEVSASSGGRGNGSEFAVRLPCLGPEVPPVRSELRAVSERPERGLRVLVVDDNRDSVRSMTLLLRRDGHEVFTASDGREAVEVALRERPLVVVLDIGLPHLDGYQACKAMREGGMGDALIIAMTGYGQEEDRQQSLRAGFDAHLVKPVDVRALRQLLAERAAEGSP